MVLTDAPALGQPENKERTWPGRCQTWTRCQIPAGAFRNNCLALGAVEVQAVTKKDQNHPNGPAPPRPPASGTGTAEGTPSTVTL